MRTYDVVRQTYDVRVVRGAHTTSYPDDVVRGTRKTRTTSYVGKNPDGT
jgi:hypothetical protein